MTTLEKPPGKVQAIGIMHLVSGILNLIMSLVWGFYGLISGAMTFGIGLVICCPVFILLPVAIVEFVSAAKHLSKDHTGLKPPRITAFLEIATLLGCSTISVICGIVTLVFLSDPEVEAYYQSKQLTG